MLNIIITNLIIDLGDQHPFQTGDLESAQVVGNLSNFPSTDNVVAFFLTKFIGDPPIIFPGLQEKMFDPDFFTRPVIGGSPVSAFGVDTDLFPVSDLEALTQTEWERKLGTEGIEVIRNVILNYLGSLDMPALIALLTQSPIVPHVGKEGPEGYDEGSNV